MSRQSLSPCDVQQYNRDGYLVVRNYVNKDETRMLREVAWRYARTLSPSEVFTTSDQTRRTGDKFMDSGYGIAAFLEEEAVNEQGLLTRPAEVSINKIGHALHELDPEVRRFTAGCGIAAESLSLKQPVVVQSMFIFKQPQIGGEVRPHRDSTFLWTDPLSCLAYWIALEDAKETNGCLWAVPGSHSKQPECRFKVDEPGGKPSMTGGALKEYEESRWIPIEAGEGDLVLIHGSLLHRSAANRSDKTRLAYTFHVIDGSPECAWSPSNWLQRPQNAPFPSFSQLA